MNADARANLRAKILVAVCFLLLLGSPIIGILVADDLIPFTIR